MTIKRKRKKTDLLICESHQILDAFYELSLTEIRILQLCLAKIYQFNKVEEGKTYPIDLNEYAEIYGMSKGAAYDTVLSGIKSLGTKMIKFKTKLIDAHATETSKTLVPWVHSITYDSNISKIDIIWHSSLVHLLGDFHQEKVVEGEDRIINKELLYSKYYLDNTSAMSSIHSIRLFRLLNKWAKKGKLERNIEEFKRLLGIPEDQYTEFDNLRRRIIDKSVKDVNLYSNLSIEVDYIRSGRKVIGIIFYIKVKEGSEIYE